MKSNPYHSIRTVCAILIAILLFITWAQGQTQEQDLEQMKTKLQQLEQEMQELKAQINKVQRAPTPAATQTTVSSGDRRGSGDTRGSQGGEKEQHRYCTVTS
jgi:peptidoglycan hydrolase CwlO-like protein